MGCSLVFCTAALYFLLLHIRQYPVAVCLLSLFLLRTMIDAKVEKIVVSDDRFVIVTRRLLPFLTKKQVFLFSAVESIHLPTGKREMLLVRYKDGDRLQVSPAIRGAQFQKAVGVMGTLNLVHLPRL